MSREMTQAEVDEIVVYCRTHPNCRIEGDAGGWCIALTDGKSFKGWMHPLSFLDMLHGTPAGIDVLKAAV